MSFFKRQNKLWKDGETNLAYITPDPSFSKEKRFKLYSIYWPPKNETNTTVHKKLSHADQLAQKVSKLIDEEEKNQLRMNKVKMQSAKKLGSAKGFVGAKDGFSTFRSTKTSISKQNEEIVRRLTSDQCSRQSKLRDRHGMRTNIIQQNEDDFIKGLNKNKNFRNESKGFYTSRRIKLDLPHNYYPGPGTYDVKRYLEESISKK